MSHYRHLRLATFVVVCLLLSLPASFMAQQTDRFPLVFEGEISDDRTSQRYDLALTDTSNITIQMTPQDDQTLVSQLYLVDKNGVIIAQQAAISSDHTAGARLNLPLVAGEYEVIATRRASRRNPSAGTFKLEIDRTVAPDIPLYPVDEATLRAANYPDIDPKAPADWTIFAYYGADTDLEEAIVRDVDEFERGGGSDEDVRVLALIDRHPDHSSIDGDWDTARLYELIASDPTQTLEEVIIDSEPIAELDEVDMGEGETLAQFLVWGIQTYPAENYVVSFGGHGAGWDGIVSDETNDDNDLSMTELRRVFETVRATTGIQQFDLLINDACLMAGIEYYDLMSDYFRYSFGSSELVTNPALDMSVLTQNLRGDDVDLRALGRELVDIYIQRDSVERGGAGYFTYAVTDLDTFDGVLAAIDRFAQVVNADPQRHVPALSRARANSYTYNSLGNKTEQIDLGDFMTQVIEFSTDFRDLIPAAQDVITALDRARVYGNAGEFAINRTTYYNIFFPLDDDDLIEYFGESELSNWEQMLINYFAYSRFEVFTERTDGLTFHVPQEPAVQITGTIPQDRTANFNAPIVVDVEVQATNVARGTFFVEQIIDERTAVRISKSPLLTEIPVLYSNTPLRDQNVWRSGVDQRRIEWKGDAFGITDGATTHIEYLQKSFDSSEAYFLEGRYRATPDEPWSDVTVTFSPDSRLEFDLRSSSFVSTNDESGTFGIFEPTIGGEFQVQRELVSLRTGRTSFDPEGNTYIITADGLGATRQPVASGEYRLTFEIESFGRDPQRDEITVTVNNDDIDPALRGQNFIEDYGFTAGIPVWWPYDLISSGAYLRSDTLTRSPRTGNPYGDSVVIDVYAYPGVQTFTEARERYIDEHDRPDNRVRFEDIYVIDGREVREFAYVSDRAIRAIATYDPTRDLSLVFGIDHRGIDAEAAEMLFDDFVATLRFYDETDVANAGRWQLVDFSPAKSAAIPQGWRASDDQTTYAAPDAPDTFARFIELPTDDTNDLRAYFNEAVNDAATNETRAQVYNGEQHLWESIQYESTRDGTPVIGRIYQTIGNNTRYLVQFEAAVSDARTVYAETFEPLLNSVLIRDLYWEIDWRESVGFTVEVPNPTLPDEPYARPQHTSADGLERMYIQQQQGEKIIETFFIPGDEADLDDVMLRLGQYWTGRNEVWSFRNAGFVTIAGQRAFEFDAQITIDDREWNGKYFAVYSEPDDLTYVLGIRGRVPIEREYNHLRETIKFELGNFSLFTSINNRPMFDTGYAFDLDIWRTSQPLRITRNWNVQGVDYVRTFDDQYGIVAYVIYDITDPIEDEIYRLEEPVNGRISQVRRIDLNGESAVEFLIERGSNDPATDTIRAVALFDEDRNRIVVAGGRAYLGGDPNVMYEQIRDSFRVIPFEG